MKNKELIRANEIISGDRLSSSDSFATLIEHDLNELLKEYFEIDKKPIVSMEKRAGEMIVNVNFKATSIKKFICIE